MIWLCFLRLWDMLTAVTDLFDRLDKKITLVPVILAETFS
ncbi:hypothetical protein Goklo_029768 [Gossypium klotzschianum]|uniref:Uncharacterized protein n=1 Tax=Gossypium klotzschianum TaxID=34286 RepID=A0A7J8W4T6_9ROSI|nr:hypothetical protein [Gossypium klotzschianum]